MLSCAAIVLAAGRTLAAGDPPARRMHAVAPAAAQPGPSPTGAPVARIKIDIDRSLGQVHPHLFGSFAEHLGRMIYGGIYDEGNPRSDPDGYRRDVMEAVRDLGVSMLRWPGGNFASGYNWKDGIGPKDRRPVRPDGAWNALERNRFGTDEFLRYAERIGAEPYICVNLGLGTIEEARQWVEYTNEARPTFWADERRRNGRDAPYTVRYWALGSSPLTFRSGSTDGSAATSPSTPGCRRRSTAWSGGAAFRTSTCRRRGTRRAARCFSTSSTAAATATSPPASTARKAPCCPRWQSGNSTTPT
jgi:alpha-L-arabinofuranosidase